MAQHAVEHEVPRAPAAVDVAVRAALMRLPRNGIRPRSSHLPEPDSSAGITVTEPIIATKTTNIAPMPSAVNVESPASSMPAIATMTVTPEISTARPDVAAAIATASLGECPRAFSSRSRRR